MTLSSIGNDLFIGDSAATSHMTNNKTGVYNLIPIRGSVMIGNGESISCTHKGKLDVICKHKDGSMARQTWEVKIVPQLNHDLFSFTKAMNEGWLMNGRWKEGGLMIELFKQTKTSMKFDRMIPSGTSWLMGIKTKRLVGQAHAAIEPGKSIPIWKFHQMTGHWSCGNLCFQPLWPKVGAMPIQFTLVNHVGVLLFCTMKQEILLRHMGMINRSTWLLSCQSTCQRHTTVPHSSIFFSSSFLVSSHCSC